MLKIYEMNGDDLADFGLAWTPLRDFASWHEEEGCILTFDHGRYAVTGWDLGQIERAIEDGVPKAKIVRYLRGMAKDMDRGD